MITLKMRAFEIGRKIFSIAWFHAQPDGGTLIYGGYNYVSNFTSSYSTQQIVTDYADEFLLCKIYRTSYSL